MLRFALSAPADVAPDIRRKLPGRGVWTRLDFATVRQAAAKQAFSRGFRAKADAAPELADDVDRLLERDALQFLSLVNKAGLVVAGAAKVEAAIAAGEVVGADPRRATARPTGRPSSIACCAALGRSRGRGPRESISLPRANWIWRWGGQM